MVQDFSDYTIRWDGHPRYTSDKVIEDDVVEVIVQKLEMILFTEPGEVQGESNMGCNLEFYLWSTNIPSTNIENVIREQISIYIPELDVIRYTLSVDLFQGVERDRMELNFNIKGYNINFLFV